MIITVRNEVAKVMFLQVSVCSQWGGGGIPAYLAGGIPGGWYPSMHCRWYPSMPCNRSPGRSAPGGGVSAPGGCLLGGGVWRTSHPKADGYCCRRYASYWKAFLLKSNVTNRVTHYHFYCKLLTDSNKS